jgi:hypothetical protein
MPTVTRIPRMQGRPLILSGLSVMRLKSSMSDSFLKLIAIIEIREIYFKNPLAKDAAGRWRND